ncbi:Metallo-dependent phosphatase-like protein [Papiliotrema laurentii]|uniref:Metallo-dependent phosphatase-like protein n=1 Tax=Papiliotrema laurentii TaxID=5418 RepID=A0AAD9FTD1_PAPLA|nr:Metallo-dependent phosphatase-like protein [Papiliotrema laurentii]
MRHHYTTLIALLLGATSASLLRRKNLPGETGERLMFDPSGSFKVVSFSDMHFGENDGAEPPAPWGAEHDAATQRVHAAILDRERPSFVVFNGDLLTGENIKLGQLGLFLEQCYGPTVSRGLPFASTYGNHDNAVNVNHEMVLQYERSAHGDLSHTRSDVGPAPFGHVNYWLPVYANQSATSPDLVMWFLDSRGVPPSMGGPDAGKNWVDENIVPPWIKAQAGAMKAKWGAVPPSIFFVHIPFSATRSLVPWNANGNNPPLWFDVQGHAGEDLPTLDAIASLGKTVLGVITGHVHGQSWCARGPPSKGIAMCFDGHSGYGGYVTPSSAVRNGRVLVFNLAGLRGDSPKVDTYNAFEDGSERDRVQLGPSFMP